MNGNIANYGGPSFVQVLLESFNSLRLLGHRSMLALLGVAVGCASIVALLNIGHSAADQAMSDFKGMGTDMLQVSFPSETSERRPIPVTLDLSGLGAAVPAIKQAAPLVLHFTQIRHEGRSAEAQVIGSTQALVQALDLQPAQGRFLSDYDSRATYAIAGSGVARELGLHTGSRVQIGNYLFEIVGIAQSKPTNPLIPARADDSIFIPITGMRRVAPSSEIDNIIVWVRENEDLEQSAAALKTYLEGIVKGRNVDIQIPRQLLEGLTQQANTFTYLLGGLGMISLLGGGIGIMNVMLMNVAERRREIGVRMAIGGRPRDIRLLFLLEAAMLSVAGAVFGAALGLMAAYAFARFSGWAFSISPLSLPLSILSSLVVGLFFGLYPAVAASRLQPVEALRDD